MLAWIISLITASLMGYHYNRLNEKVNKLIEERRLKKPLTENRSMVIDPDDAIQMAQLEREKTFRDLNP